jgi:PAS domain S-box-containing protein
MKRESEARLDLIHHCARLGYIDIDARTLEVFWSDETFRLLGYPPRSFTPTHRSFLERVHPDDLETVQEDISALLMEYKVSDSEYRILRPDGETLWVYGRGDLVRDEKEKPLRFIIVLFDITTGKRHDQQIKASVREKEVLLKEIHHRVKNNLQIISSLISLQASKVKDEESRMLFDESRSRIRALALVHERLYWSESLASIDFKEYLKRDPDLVHGSATEHLSIDLDADHIMLDIDQAIPCGLIVNELCANALKHAFLHRPGGTITVSLHRGSENKVILGVRDDGIGLPPGFDIYRETSMGMTLVTSLWIKSEGWRWTASAACEVAFRPQTHPEPPLSLRFEQPLKFHIFLFHCLSGIPMAVLEKLISYVTSLPKITVTSTRRVHTLSPSPTAISISGMPNRLSELWHCQEQPGESAICA